MKEYWEIAKEFEISYGHRVWAQDLNCNFSLDNKCSCKMLHGHNARIILYLGGPSLNDQGMILDFKNLNWVKQWLDNVVDHKFIMDINDPLLNYDIRDPLEKFLGNRSRPLSFINHNEEYSTVDEKCYADLEDVIKEKYESYIFVNFVPTSENLSKWIFDVVQRKLNEINIKVAKVEFYETPKSKSTYVFIEDTEE